MTLVPEAGAGEDVNHVSVAMRVTYTPTYPEAPPDLSLRPVRRGGLTDEGISECEGLLREAAASEELLGTAMVYALAEKCIEWLAEHNTPEMDMHAEMMARHRAQEDAAAAQPGGDGEDAVDIGDGGGALRGRNRGTGAAGGTEGSWRRDVGGDAAATSPAGAYTPVTPETFAAFRKEWEAQRAAAKAAKRGTAAGKDRNRATADDGLTGRQLFERGDGSTLIDSDAGALADGEEDVMSAREAMEEDAAAAAGVGAGAAAAQGEGDGGGESAGVTTALLEQVGNAALFDDEDEELPDDDD